MRLKQIWRKYAFALSGVLMILLSLIIPLMPQIAYAASPTISWTNISTLHAVSDYHDGDTVSFPGGRNTTVTPDMVSAIDGDYQLATVGPYGIANNQLVPGDPFLKNGTLMLVYTQGGVEPNLDCGNYIFTPAMQESGRNLYPATDTLSWVESFPDPLSPGKCNSLLVPNIKGENPDNRDIWFNWVTETTIEPAGKLPIEQNTDHGDKPMALTYSTFEKDNNGAYPYKGNLALGGEQQCYSFLKAHDDLDFVDMLLFRGNRDGTPSCIQDTNNDRYAAKTVRIGNRKCRDPGSNCQTTAPSAGGLSGNDPDFVCHSNIPVLGWFVCSIIDGLHSAANALNQAIICHLQLPVNQYFNSTKGSGTTTAIASGNIQCPSNNVNANASDANYKLWSTFRYIALGLLVLVALIMVIAQAIGSSTIDAYTVKKVLPRLVAAAILIALSWELGRFFVQLSNDLATGVRQILQAVSPPSINLNVNGATTGISAVGFVAGGAALSLLGWVSALTVLLTVLLAVAIAFLIIIFRELIIVFCVVTAPIAFVAFILPNTQKVWKLWKDTFQGALLIFPMIVGFIYLGRLLAAIESQQVKDDPIGNIAVLALYFGPYFLIPATLKFTTGLLSTLGGMVNDRGKGVFDRMSKFRRDRAADRIKKFRAGGYYGSGTARGRFGNKVGTFLFNPDEKIPHMLGEHKVPGFRGQYTKLQAKINKEKEEQTFEFTKTANEVGANDQTGRVMSGAFLDWNDEKFSDDTRRELINRFYDTDEQGNAIEGTFKGLNTEKDWNDAAAIMAKSDNEPERHASTALQALKGHALNLNRDGKGYTDVAAAGGLIVASHGFMTEKDLVTVGQNLEKKGGEVYAETMMTQMEVNGKNSGLKVTYSHSRDRKSGKLITGTKAGRGWDRALSKSYQEVFSQKKHAVQSDVNELVDVIKTSKMSQAEQLQKAEEWKQAGFSPQQIEARFKDIHEKAQIAANTLSSGLQWAPGASDSGVVALSAKEELLRSGITEEEFQTLAARGRGGVIRDDDNPDIRNQGPGGGGGRFSGPSPGGGAQNFGPRDIGGIQNFGNQ